MQLQIGPYSPLLTQHKSAEMNLKINDAQATGSAGQMSPRPRCQAFIQCSTVFSPMQLLSRALALDRPGSEVGPPHRKHVSGAELPSRIGRSKRRRGTTACPSVLPLLSLCPQARALQGDSRPAGHHRVSRRKLETSLLTRHHAVKMSYLKTVLHWANLTTTQSGVQGGRDAAEACFYARAAFACRVHRISLQLPSWTSDSMAEKDGLSPLLRHLMQCISSSGMMPALLNSQRLQSCYSLEPIAGSAYAACKAAHAVSSIPQACPSNPAGVSRRAGFLVAPTYVLDASLPTMCNTVFFSSWTCASDLARVSHRKGMLLSIAQLAKLKAAGTHFPIPGCAPEQRDER